MSERELEKQRLQALAGSLICLLCSFCPVVWALGSLLQLKALLEPDLQTNQTIIDLVAHHCPTRGHLAMYDDQDTYFRGLIRFIEDVDQGN